MRTPALSLLAALATLGATALVGCGPSLVDCEAIAAEQPDCVNEDALAECQAANTACENGEGSEVLVTEGCPLTFSCAAQTP